MPNRIDDGLPIEMSKQRRWQIRKERLGLCSICGFPQGKRKGYCDRHYRKRAKKQGIKKPFKYKVGK